MKKILKLLISCTFLFPAISTPQILSIVDKYPIVIRVTMIPITESHIMVNSTNLFYRKGLARALSADQFQQFFNIATKNGKLFYVLTQAKSMNLPASVAAVPFVESRYDDNAVSNKGAAGAWQLMPALAKDYGLPQQDRFEFTSSTNVALTYLKQLYAQFGSWELTYAAYNAGPTRVQNALLRNPHATSVQELSLPQETKNYVVRLDQFRTDLILLARNNEKTMTCCRVTIKLNLPDICQI
jgi:hypothetical protein